jgi:hypothetical protein
MGNGIARVFLVTALGMASSAVPEVSNVEVGGELTLYGEWYVQGWPEDTQERWPASALRGRSIGTADNAVGSYFGFDDREPGSLTLTQWTRLHVMAELRHDVSAFLEFDHQLTWGDAFRSGVVTGVDTAGAGDVAIYQAYMEMEDAWGIPLRVRLGRQEIVLGNEFLVGNNDAATVPIFGLSFDGLRLTYTVGDSTIDAFAASLAGADRKANDVYFAGLYTTWAPTESLALSGYWLWYHDGTPVESPASTSTAPWLERLLGVEAYGDTEIHTTGGSVAYAVGGLALGGEVAYQWGDAAHAGALFRPGLYGDDDAAYNAWALQLDGSYTFEARWQPSVYGSYTYLGGKDQRESSAGEWLHAMLTPYQSGRASLRFNRLFSDYVIGSFLDASELSGVHAVTLGASVSPADTLYLSLDVMYLRAVDAFERPALAPLSFVTQPNDQHLGWETYLGVSYAYSDDLEFNVGWSHFFTGRGAAQGHFLASNGLDFTGGSAQDDLDAFFFRTTLRF